MNSTGGSLPINKTLMNDQISKNINIENLISIAKMAGAEILKIYKSDNFDVELKSDNSPLTKSDKKSHEIICSGLKEYYPEIPILSEESKEILYDERKKWNLFWLVDPLDGTKEFIKRNGEFTVNIALIENQKPILGVIYAPVMNEMFYASRGNGAYKIIGNQKIIITRSEDPKNLSLRASAKQSLSSACYPERDFRNSHCEESEVRHGNLVRVIVSRSHLDEKTKSFVEELKTKYSSVECVEAGSSYKFCLLADSKADVYPRFGPTMEWDTAAGHIIANEAGFSIKNYETQNDLVYNKENLKNPSFVVQRI